VLLKARHVKMYLIFKKQKRCAYSGYISAGVGNLPPAGRIRPAKQNHPARSPFTNCNCIRPA